MTCRGRPCPSVRPKRVHKNTYTARTWSYMRTPVAIFYFFHRSFIYVHYYIQIASYRLEFDIYFQVVFYCLSQNRDLNIRFEWKYKKEERYYREGQCSVVCIFILKWALLLYFFRKYRIRSLVFFYKEPWSVSYL